MPDARSRIHAMFPLTEGTESELDVRLDALVKDAFAAGREAAGADGWKLTGFRPVFSRSDGSDRPVNELRCDCGRLVQRPGDASLLDLVILAARHECGGRS